MRIAMAQISAGTDPDDNLGLIRATLDALPLDSPVDLVVFPEATMRRFGVELASIAQPIDGPWADAVVAEATARGITLIVGMFTPGPDPAHVFNTLLVALPSGQRHGYDKIHLFDAFGFAESDTVSAGQRPVIVSVPTANGPVPVGVSTCYDVRFPALYRRLADAGAQVITVSASWGDGPGKREQWDLLTRARALDSTSYIVAVGQSIPTDPDAQKSSAPTGIGHSIAVDPTGSVLAELGPEPTLRIVEIDPSRTHQVRRQIPVLDNARDISDPFQFDPAQ